MTSVAVCPTTEAVTPAFLAVEDVPSVLAAVDGVPSTPTVDASPVAATVGN